MSINTPFAAIEAEIARETHAAFGVDGIYTAADGTPLPCRVVIDRNVEIFGEMGQVIDRRATVAFLSAEVPLPVRGATVVAGATMRVDKIIEDDGVVVKVLVTK